MTRPRALAGLVVTEVGRRLGTSVCGSLLAQLGATVIVVEQTDQAHLSKVSRAQLSAGKLSLLFNAKSEADRTLLAKLMANSDVVLTSSDVDPPELQVTTAEPANIVCDVSAFGSSGPRAGCGLTEMQVQALSGLIDTTGPADGAPVPINVPFTGYAAGTYAAAAVLAALRVKRVQGFGQRVEVAMFDAAFTALNAFLAGVLTGQVDDRSRVGNRHPTVAPWNLYQTADGCILICAGNQGQWEKLCAQMGRPDIAAQFNTQAARLDGIDAVDGAIDAWTRTLSTADCVARLVAVGVASGPIAPIDSYVREANLDFRAMIRALHDPLSGADMYLSASPLTLLGSPPVQAEWIPAPGADRAEIERVANALFAPRSVALPKGKTTRPLAGLRIVEIGQYTSAPMCARLLAHLGAEVIKIEKPGGDEQRAWTPHFGGRSETFLLNNPDKRAMVIDLLSDTGKATLRALLASADVLVENNKPGMLAKFGFSVDELARINPRLVYCAVSAFGARSLYANRAGFDTVIQAASGFMTALRPEGLPLKSGISAADVMGAEMALVAILGALEYREHSGHGQAIDLSMQDISCWLAAPAWNTDLKSIPRPSVLACTDGYVLADIDASGLAQALKGANLSLPSLAQMKRDQAAALLARLGLPSAPVLSIKEASELEQTKTRGVWTTVSDGELDWPVVGCPLRLQRTPASIASRAPDVDQDGAAIRQQLGLQ